MLQSAWKMSPEIQIRQDPNVKRIWIGRKLFVNLLIYRGILVLEGPNVLTPTIEADFWRNMVKEGADSVLRVSFNQTPTLSSDHYRLFLYEFEKLRIIQIPNFHCTNRILESIAVRLPCLQ